MEKVTWRNELLQISLFVSLVLIGCHGNRISYKHLPQSETEIKVDKIITLDSEVETISQADKEDNKLLDLLEELRLEIGDLKESRKNDRHRLRNMEKRLENYHEEIIVSVAEVVQLRQLVSESYDKTNTLEDVAKDFNLFSQNFPYFEKNVQKEFRRLSEYKERAAKRFHHIEKSIQKLEKSGETTHSSVTNLTQEFESFHINLTKLKTLSDEIQENLTESLNISSQCCNQSHISLDTLSENDILKLLHSKTGIAKGGNSNFNLPTSGIEITEFGSGEVHEYLPLPHLVNTQEQSQSLETSYLEQVEQGSGEVTHVSEGSGEVEHESSGDTIELPPFFDRTKYVHRDLFLKEISIRESRFLELGDKFTNLTEYVEELETRLTSIQLGNFMQQLQESFINFTQNVLTVDQYKMTSSQIVNSTLINQDSIVKLTNMILENTEKITDLRWKSSNAELLSDQQFNILRMYVIRMNNSIEDLKDEMKKLESRTPLNNGYQAAYYGYNPGYGAQIPRPGNQHGGKTQGTNQNMDTVSSRLDQLGLQIVYNQNRIGNLEVKLLNESLYTCRKYNMDSYQDSQLAAHESMIKANLNSILLNHELLKTLDDAVNAVEQGFRLNSRKMRLVLQNLDRFRNVIPVMVHMKQEIDHFMYQLPADCSEYYQRGYRKSGVYVIHPITAKKSSQVTCHMTQNGGWTVIQQRFDGLLMFNRNWTSYRKGFGQAESEYWIGADIVYMLTSRQNYSLMIEMVDINDIKWTATYAEFAPSSPDDKFTLRVSGYQGNATDNMEYSNSFAFSTPDRDNDASGTNCAYFYESGWWFKHCQLCNLNGRYDIGFMWFNLDTSSWIRLKSSVMKIKPR